jgi:hypothetical protein
MFNELFKALAYTASYQGWKAGLSVGVVNKRFNDRNARAWLANVCGWGK